MRKPARLPFDPGEIYDHEFMPHESGKLTLEFGFLPPPPPPPGDGGHLAGAASSGGHSARALSPFIHSRRCREKSEITMRLLRTIVVGSALAGLLSPNHLAAQTTDNFIGTWKLNVAQSKFSPGPGPKSMTVTFEKATGGFKLTAKGVGANDAPINNSYTAMYDGMDAAVTGSADWDAVSVKMLDANTRHTVRKLKGKEVQTVHSVVSKDGKHYTSTTTGVNAKGEKVNSTAVYDKQ